MHVDAVRDDKKLSIPIDNRMAGRCLLCVFSPEQQKALDVLVFFVKNKCNVRDLSFLVIFIKVLKGFTFGMVRGTN